MTDTLEEFKRAAARQALEHVKDGMVLGLGTGSTAEQFLAGLGERVQAGLRVTGVPTSERSASLARGYGIPLADVEDLPRIDLTVDGADEIEPTSLTLVKGRGGALLREKLVAANSDQVFIVADTSKLVQQIGEHFALPVAVVPFGWRRTADGLATLGCEPALRTAGDRPFRSDDGLYMLDCQFGPIADPQRLAAQIKALLGVVEHGLFVGLADRALVAGPEGVQVFAVKGV
ncbi:MAG: ribose-5-phosphate isomerase RpiA [Chloroflexi bacterium]|nr:ribose-5-phosphate isomerase RpiA [Chloroflexota bacterium]